MDHLQRHSIVFRWRIRIAVTLQAIERDPQKKLIENCHHIICAICACVCRMCCSSCVCVHVCMFGSETMFRVYCPNALNFDNIFILIALLIYTSTSTPTCMFTLPASVLCSTPTQLHAMTYSTTACSHGAKRLIEYEREYCSSDTSYIE